MKIVDSPRVGRASAPQLAVVGLCGGVLSGLLGIGGGSVFVPLLVLWLMWEEHRATATSLAALIFAAAAGTAAYASDGDVDPAKALLIGIPAVGGVLIGTRIAAKLPGDVLLLMFTVVQISVATMLIVG